MVPRADHLISPKEPLDTAYYIRHRIETVKRIQMTSRTDALALAAMAKRHYQTAKSWGDYLNEEMKHDVLYRKDLAVHGVTDTAIDGTPPFRSTALLVGYLMYELDRIGPLAAVAYSVFVEWNSERFSRVVVEKAEAQFSKGHAKGSRAHLGIDEHEDHYATMVKIVAELIETPDDEEAVLNTIRNIAHLFREYFRELHEATVASNVHSRADSVA